MLLFQPKKEKKKIKLEKGAADALLTWAVLNGLPSAPHHFDSPLDIIPHDPYHTHTHTHTNELFFFLSFFLLTVAAFFFFTVFCFFDGGVIQCFPFFLSLISDCVLCIGSFCSGRGIISFHPLCVCAFSVFFSPIFPIRKLVGSEQTPSHNNRSKASRRPRFHVKLHT